jgi:N-acyl-D-amino-acid deacylase
MPIGRGRFQSKAGENGLPPTGIPFVIVHGTIVVNEGRVQPVKPGQPIRFPVLAKGRFERATINKWLGEYSINVPDLHQFDETGAGQMSKRE